MREEQNGKGGKDFERPGKLVSSVLDRTVCEKQVDKENFQLPCFNRKKSSKPQSVPASKFHELT